MKYKNLDLVLKYFDGDELTELAEMINYHFSERIDHYDMYDIIKNRFKANVREFQNDYSIILSILKDLNAKNYQYFVRNIQLIPECILDDIGKNEYILHLLNEDINNSIFVQKDIELIVGDK